MYSIPFWSTFEIATVSYFFNDRMVNRKKSLVFKYSLFYNLYSPCRDIGFSTATTMKKCTNETTSRNVRSLWLTPACFLTELYSKVSNFYGTFYSRAFPSKRRIHAQCTKNSFVPYHYGNSQFDHSQKVLTLALSEVTARLNIV